MSTSTIGYKARYFWGNDVELALWMHFMAEEAAKIQKRPDWLQRLQAEMERKADIGASCDLELDQFARDDNAVRLILHLIDQVDKSLDRFAGGKIDVPELERMGVGGTTFFGAEDVSEVKRVGRSVTKLLRGDAGRDPTTYPIEVAPNDGARRDKGNG